MAKKKSRQNGINVSGDRWVHLLDQFGIGALIIGADRRVTACNQSLTALVGAPESGVIGSDCRDIFRELDCRQACPLDPEWDTLGGSVELEIVDAGERRHLVTRLATPLYDKAGNVAGCLAAFQDHSALADLINRVNYDAISLKMILDNLNIGIFTVNRGGHVTFFNTAAERISGYSRNQVLGKTAGNILCGGDKGDMSRLSEAMAECRPRTNHRTRILTHEGERLPVRADYLPLLNDQGRTVGGMVTLEDLTLADHLVQVIGDRFTFHNMIGKDPEMQRIFETVRAVAPTDSTILIEGATGTGKDLLAKVIRSASHRSDRPFVKVNCAAIPENLLESELFGYTRGAFSGADKDKPGRFNEADRGTIFLDEIGDLPLHLQAKLLRVLDDKEFYPLGSRTISKVDVRVISATNRDLAELVRQRLFREDLFYRLNVLRIELPALKDRPSDLPLLIRHIVRKLSAARPGGPVDVSDEAMALLMSHDWPGNVRQLENILEHALIISRSGVIESKHFAACLGRKKPHGPACGKIPDKPPRGLPDSDREKILEALAENDWQRAKTADSLGMDRTTLWRKMKKYGIRP